MRHTSVFTAFLKDTVDLNQTRLDELRSNVQAVYDVLCHADNLKGAVQRRIPQGSWAHKTIIKPVDDKEFDADVLIEFNASAGWDRQPVAYLDGLEAALRNHGTYGTMLDGEKHSRCVRVTYANQHHLDIVPYRVLGDGRKVIVNRDTRDWEDTDPEGLTQWMAERDDITDNNFRRVVRLLKFLRDFSGRFVDTPSIILTTLAGDVVGRERKVAHPGCYRDVPECLHSVVMALDVQLQAQSVMPTILDPSGVTSPDGKPVTFNHRWSQSAYIQLRASIHQLASQIDVAFGEQQPDRSLDLWQGVFGDDFRLPGTDAPKRTILSLPFSSASHRAGQAG